MAGCNSKLWEELVLLQKPLVVGKLSPGTFHVDFPHPFWDVPCPCFMSSRRARGGMSSVFPIRQQLCVGIAVLGIADLSPAQG